MFRSNTVESVRATGLVQIDAGEGVALSVPVEPPAVVETGLRKINDLSTTRTAGDIYLWRSGKMVFVQFTGLRDSGQGVGTGFGAVTLPVGFRPRLNIIDPTPIHAVASELQYTQTEGGPVLNVPRTIIGTNGLVRFFGADPVVAIYFTCSFMTADLPPSSLPGVAA